MMNIFLTTIFSIVAVFSVIVFVILLVHLFGFAVAIAALGIIVIAANEAAEKVLKLFD